MKYGFDNDKYLKIQSEHIKERIAKFGDKLYMEFGGKLFDDYHASRVLPGFHPDSKMQMLLQLKDDVEIVIVISAVDIQKNKIRSDLGITYDMDVLRLRDEFLERDLSVNSVVITHFNGQASAEAYRKRLENMGIKVYYHHTIEGYPQNVALIDSDEGFGKNDYVETTKPLLGPSAALLLNALKHLAGIPHNIKLIPQNMIGPIQRTKVDYLHGHNPRLHTDEVLVAISMMSLLDENCQLALAQLPNLVGAQVHSSVMLSEVDRKTFNKLGVGLTCDPIRKFKPAKK